MRTEQSRKRTFPRWMYPAGHFFRLSPDIYEEGSPLLDTILKYWVQWACGLGAAALSAGLRLLYRRQKQLALRQQATERGIRALLRDRIVQAYYHNTKRGWITLHSLENVEALYQEYHALGGNGTVTKLVEDLRELEVRDGRPPAAPSEQRR